MTKLRLLLIALVAACRPNGKDADPPREPHQPHRTEAATGTPHCIATDPGQTEWVRRGLAAAARSARHDAAIDKIIQLVQPEQTDLQFIDQTTLTAPGGQPVEAVLLGRDWDHHVAVAIGPDFLHAAPLPLRRAVSLRAEPRPTGTGEVLRVSGTRSWGTGLRIDETFILGPDLDPKLRFTSRYVNTTFRAVEVLELDTALHPATEERRAELVTAAALQIDANRFPAPGAGAGLQLALERRHALTELDDHSWAVEPMEQGATRCRLWQANTCSDEALVEAVSPELLEAFQDSQGEGRCAFALLDYIVSGHTLAVEGRQACKQSTKPERR